MVATRRSKASHAETGHHAHEEDTEPVVVENPDSDSDDAPEEVNLTTSRHKALRERREQRQVQQHAQRVEKTKRSRAQNTKQPEREEEAEQELDVLPECILEAVAREDEEEGFESDQEDDRRALERRIVSEQLRQGIVQARKKKFKERRVGPVTVKSLQNAENPSTRAADAARSFLQERMGRVERRAVSGIQRNPGKQKTFSYF